MVAGSAKVTTALQYAAVAHLLYSAWKLWNAPLRSADSQDHSADSVLRLFLVGFSIQLIHVNALVFFLGVLPIFVDLEALTIAGFAELFAVIILTVVAVLGAYTLIAARASRLLTSPRALRAANRSSSLALVGVAVAIVAQ